MTATRPPREDEDGQVTVTRRTREDETRGPAARRPEPTLSRRQFLPGAAAPIRRREPERCGSS